LKHKKKEHIFLLHLEEIYSTVHFGRKALEGKAEADMWRNTENVIQKTFGKSL